MPGALRHGAAVVITIACGACRFGFHEAKLDGSVDAMIDAPVDAPPEARIVSHSFGERVGAMHTNVTADATLAQAAPTMALGLNSEMGLAGIDGTIERGALRFDVSALAPGTLVVAARLELVRLDLGDEFPAPLGIRTIGEAWLEDKATWNEHHVGLTWTTAGGAPSTTLHAMIDALSSDAFAIALPVGIVQGWVDTPATNRGVLLVMVDETVDGHYHVHSRESQLVDSRPLLVVDVVE